MKRLFILMLVLAVAATIIGCSSPTATTSTSTTPAPTSTLPTTPTSVKPTTTPTPTPTQVSGGVLKIGSTVGTILDLGDPARNWSGLDPAYARPAVECLVAPASDGSGNPAPALATSWQYSSDYTSITFNLRKGVMFHDGTPFNAQAAKFCLDLMRAGPRQELKTVTSIDVVDDYTIKLNLSVYQPSFLHGMEGFVSMMVSPTNYQKIGADKAAFAPVGTGPFIFESFTPSVSIKFKRFDGYWGPKAYLDGVEVDLFADAMTSLAALKGGQIDATKTINMSDFADLVKTPDYTYISITAFCLGLVGDSAHADSPFANIKVRQAVSYALNTKAIADVVGYGYYEAGKGLVPQRYPSYDPTTVGYPYNVAKAKELLAQAGYANGFSTTLYYPTNRAPAFTVVQSQLKEVGINVEGKVTQSNQQYLAQGWDKSLVSMEFNCAPDYDLGLQLLNDFSSKATYITPKSLDIPADYDAKLAATLVERDPNKYLTALQGLMKDIIDKYCMVTPVYFLNPPMISHSYVRDFDWYKYANAYWDPGKAWMAKH